MSSDPRHEYKRRWRLAHPESVRRSNQKQYWKNIDTKRIRDREYREKNRERVRAYMKKYSQAYYLKNKERIKQRTTEYIRNHPEVRRRSHLNYKMRHPERFRKTVQASNARMRIVRSSADVGDTRIAGVIAKWRSQKTFKCFHCSKRFSIKDMEVDHLLPISRGGKHVVENVRKSCGPCNNRKRAKILKPLLQRLGLRNFCFMIKTPTPNDDIPKPATI